MEALVYHRPGRKSLDEWPMPALVAPIDAIVNMTRTITCRADLHILNSCVSSWGKCDCCRRWMYSHCTTGGRIFGRHSGGTGPNLNVAERQGPADQHCSDRWRGSDRSGGIAGASGAAKGNMAEQSETKFHRSRIKSGHVRGVPRDAGVQPIIHEDHGSLKEPML